MKRQMAFLSGVILLLPALALAAEVGAPVEVAPKAEATRNQTWASTGWCEGAKCWLVVWREGYLNELESDIWCARFSADGKALDPAGIRLTKGKGLKDRPRVAADGKNFLVVWEDLGKGKDWDVRAARVSSEGKILDAEGLLVAGGEHNQCRPDVAFAKGNYCVVWMGFVNGGYGIYGTRISPDGRVLDGKPMEVVVFNKGGALHSILPLAAANHDGEELSACTVSNVSYASNYLERRPIDPGTGQPTGALRPPQRQPTMALPGAGNFYQRGAALAMGSGEALAASRGAADYSGGKLISLSRLSKTGEFLGKQELGSTPTEAFQPRPALAFDGKAYLLVSDCLVSSGGAKKGTPAARRTQITGWRVAPDGKADAEFVVAAEGDHDLMLPAAAAGPEGVSLVVYSEVRGVDDVKVLARTVKN